MTFQRVTFTDEAIADLQDLADRFRRLLIEAMRIAKKVDEGTISTKQLQHFTKTGDLSDCSRVYFGAQEGESTHRMVLREVAPDTDTPTEQGEAAAVEVVEVAAVAERAEDVAYLLTSLRLGRLDDDPVLKADAKRKIATARKKKAR